MSQPKNTPVLETQIAPDSSVIVVHHLNNSRSQRILWLLEELGVPYQIKKYYRTAAYLAPDELLGINPLGKSPVITDGAVTLAESGAIVEYLIRKYGKKQELSESQWLDNLYFTHFAEGTLQPHVFHRLLFTVIPERASFLIRPLISPVFSRLDQMLVEPNLVRCRKLVEDHLAKTGGWFAGGTEPTSADYMMSFALETLLSRDLVNTSPKIKEWVAMVQARPAYQRALEKGGEYAYSYKL